MQLDKFTDYGLRILVTLAAKTPARIPTSSIAQVFDLSEHHLSKVASELVRCGFVTSERGRNGGLTLARDATQINLGAVVRGLQSDKPVVSCFGTDKSCLILPTCGLRSPLAEAQEAFYAALDRYTLADVTAQKSALAGLLSDLPSAKMQAS
ncbi:MAG: Rrf2 family transcriptional regulator [Yoonia sp.]|nr:Rrf2 family transcriptional regulator [Yoonia sp.]